MKKIQCPYCCSKYNNIDNAFVESNANGILLSEFIHQGLDVQLRVNAHDIIPGDDKRYLHYIKKHPGAIVIKSDQMVTSYSHTPIYMELAVRYCPFCGRELSFMSKDNLHD